MQGEGVARRREDRAAVDDAQRAVHAEPQAFEHRREVPGVDRLAVDRGLTAHRLEPGPVQERRAQRMAGERLVEPAERERGPRQRVQQRRVGGRRRRRNPKPIVHAEPLSPDPLSGVDQRLARSDYPYGGFGAMGLLFRSGAPAPRVCLIRSLVGVCLWRSLGRFEPVAAASEAAMTQPADPDPEAPQAVGRPSNTYESEAHPGSSGNKGDSSACGASGSGSAGSVIAASETAATGAKRPRLGQRHTPDKRTLSGIHVQAGAPERITGPLHRIPDSMGNSTAQVIDLRQEGELGI